MGKECSPLDIDAVCATVTQIHARPPAPRLTEEGDRMDSTCPNRRDLLKASGASLAGAAAAPYLRLRQAWLDR